LITGPTTATIFHPFIFRAAHGADRIQKLQGAPNPSATASSEEIMARVLIVDDSPSQLMGMKLIIERLGHETITAEDGAQGVEAAKRELPDLILMDVVMPNLNGFQATRSISKEPSTSHIPIVLVTTKDQETDRVWGIRQGAKAYLTKPVNEAQLVKLVKDLLPS
jgi:twitching motility two-component system response regulator PilH